MAEEQGFTQARARLEEIVMQVRKKDTSLEQSLDLLEEGVRLANQCTELVDHSEWRTSSDVPAEPVVAEVAADMVAPSESSTGVEAAVMATERPHDGDEPVAGTDAAPAGEGAAPRAAEDAERDEYDDIFADED